MKKTLVEIRNLTIGNKENKLFTDVSFDICEGDCIMLCGANGSGKTTLMKTLASLSEKSCEITMIPTRIPKVKGFTVKDFIRISCYRQSSFSGKLAPSDELAMEDAMARLKIKTLADRDISTLSDGEFQKAGIASCLVRKASVILSDEPTAFLDAENRITALNTLRELCETKTSNVRPAVIFSTHDLHDGIKVANKVIALGADKQFRCSDKDLSRIVETIFTR